MTITKVKYEKLFPTGAYLNEKIGFEADLNSTMDAEQTNKLALICIEELRNLAEQSHKEKYPYLYTSNGKPITYSTDGIAESQMNVPATIIDRKKIDETEIKIDNCTTVEELKGLEVDALKYGLVNQYINKKKSFQ